MVKALLYYDVKKINYGETMKCRIVWKKRGMK